MTASDIATTGGEVVGQVVQTMNGINDSSKEIASITGIIDELAFKTNILALNAAVEAARAGEQGRGFAVVAAEVRSPAQRSGQGAREIKDLISDSVKRVGQGMALVEHSGSTMQEIVVAIKRVSNIVTEISAASSEQSIGVTQISTAVSQIDEVTQQNAALVEETAAATEHLKMQAKDLVQAVAVFKLAVE
ncbi:methyl-accepting chemotaxis protein [Paraburkholderia sediminicola]|uniref:methyl-accepting chemotaxis protein n=1 Tax=Paraburkholderia sediminicola TaxID=458836 RepID=UPI0038B705C4